VAARSIRYVEIARHQRLELPTGLEGDSSELFAVAPDGRRALAFRRRADLEGVKGSFQALDRSGDGVEFWFGHG